VKGRAVARREVKGRCRGREANGRSIGKGRIRKEINGEKVNDRQKLERKQRKGRQ
jgi:hypothetical protein